MRGGWWTHETTAKKVYASSNYTVQTVHGKIKDGLNFGYIHEIPTKSSNRKTKKTELNHKAHFSLKNNFLGVGWTMFL